MTKIVSFLKSTRWILYAALAIGTGVLLFTLRHLFFGDPPKATNYRLPDVPEPLRKKVEAAQEEAVKAKVEAKITAVEDKVAVEEILKIEDGTERRKRLAEKLRTL